MIPQETVNQILDAVQIVDVVSDYVTLKRRGANYVACCPFHNERTPSFSVSPSRGIYKCFGCGKAGNAVGFVMEQEHCSYVEALRYLAKKYNIEIQEEEVSAEEIAKRQRNESLLLVSEFAQKFFVDQLRTPEGEAVAAQYYQSRGIEDETVAKFGLGWAPSGRTSLVDAALAQGYKMEYLLAAGVAVQHEDGSIRDKFRERVMFPVHSVSGRVIAFSGRTLRSDNPAKYVNSPETEIYIKSRNLLGIYFAKSEISKLDKCILVEGNIDMVMMHQLGIRNVVASCGTSLTVEQVRLIHKFTDNVTIMYDGDSAGIHAALRGLSLILAEGMNVKLLLLPPGEDPDSFSRKHTLQEVLAFIEENERDFIAFKTELLLQEAKGDPLKKAGLINDIADTIAEIPDPVKRSTYVEMTAQRFGIESSLIFNRIHSSRKNSDAALEQAPVQQQAWVEENKTLALTERDLVEFLLKHGDKELDFQSDSEFFAGEDAQKPRVAEFIIDALEYDGTKMANSAYASVYEAYLSMYDQGLSQTAILNALMSSPDRKVAEVAAQLSIDKYSLTVQAYKNSMTTTSSWLAVQVPRSIMCYAERRMQDSLDKLRRLLMNPDMSDEEKNGIVQEIVKLQSAQRRIKQKIGREKTI